MYTRVLISLATLLLLLAVTVTAFRFFDARSHSASDTLRPLVLTMAPLWGMAAWAARRLLRLHH